MSYQVIDKKGKYDVPEDDPQRECKSCAHVSICAMYRAILPLMKQWEDDERPFEVTDLARICRVYAPVFIEIKEDGSR